MKPTKIPTIVYLDCHFVSRNFAVLPELMGQSHKFSFRGHPVMIVLPSVEAVDKSDNAAATCHSWVLIEEKEVPAQYSIHRIGVKIGVDEPLPLHPDMLTRPMKTFDLLNDEERLVLDTLVDETSALAVDAYEYWLSVLRWVANDYRIGRDAVVGNATGRNPTLTTLESGKRIWAATVVIKFESERPISSSAWSKAETLLVAGEQTPSYVSLLHDAKEYHRRGDFRRCLIDVAVSCEVFLRSQVLSSISPDLPASLTVAIEQMNISQYVSKFFPEILDSEGRTKFKRLKEELTSLFGARNDIMHMHKNERSTSEQCVRFIDLASNLFALDQHIV
jgi:hypothetical protein